MMIMTLNRILFLMALLTFLGCIEESQATNQIWDDYPLVRDKRNFKESKGGKGVPAQGTIIIKPQVSCLLLNEGRIQEYQPSDRNWQYMVAMNCRRGERPLLEILREVQTKLLSEDKRQRLAIVLGINERVTVDNSPNYAPTWSKILGTNDIEATFREFNIPILLVYFQWTSFRQSIANTQLGALEIRDSIFNRLAMIQNPRQRTVAHEKLLEQDLSHQFPFGQARTYLMQNIATQNFIVRLHQQNCSVYVHIQDSDFISYDEPLIFGDYQGNSRLIPVNQNRLLEKFDEVITCHRNRSGRLPVIVGGAHVYSPTEDLSEYMTRIPGKESLNDLQAKYWTRFTSEVGNNIKHLQGQQQPYGLYFHEPNTLVLSPYSALVFLQTETSPEWQKIYARLSKGFHFGIDSEVQMFTRAIFKGIKDEVCRQGMVFSSSTVLSTSMKSGIKPFAIKFSGTYNPATNRFEGCTNADLSAMRGMKQETIMTNKWGSSIATSFKRNSKRDARTFVYEVLRLFDPIDLLDPTQAASYSAALVSYEAIVLSRKQEAQLLYQNLSELYNKLGSGPIVAEQVITAGWESAQIMRLMFLDHLQPPQGLIIPEVSKRDRYIRDFLSWRFNFMTDATEPLKVKNPFVAELLYFAPRIEALIPVIPLEPLKQLPILNQHTNRNFPLLAPVAMKPTERTFDVTESKVMQLVSYIYTKRGNNRAQTARDLSIDARAVSNLMVKKAPIVWKKVADRFNTDDKIRQNLSNFANDLIDEIIELLSRA